MIVRSKTDEQDTQPSSKPDGQPVNVDLSACATTTSMNLTFPYNYFAHVTLRQVRHAQPTHTGIRFHNPKGTPEVVVIESSIAPIQFNTSLWHMKMMSHLVAQASKWKMEQVYERARTTLAYHARWCGHRYPKARIRQVADGTVRATIRDWWRYTACVIKRSVNFAKVELAGVKVTTDAEGNKVKLVCISLKDNKFKNFVMIDSGSEADLSPYLDDFTSKLVTSLMRLKAANGVPIKNLGQPRAC